MLVAHNGLRGIGHAGFICQAHAWLAGRVDVDNLKAALVQLHRRFPVVTSRLEEARGNFAPYWQFRTNVPPILNEVSVPASDDATVWKHSARLFERPLDHSRTDPITFHLLHLPDGRDVLMMVFSHVLMDGKAPEYVLKHLDDCYSASNAHQLTTDVLQERSATASSDEMAEHLLRFDKKRRRQAAWNVIKSHIRLPVRPVTMTAPHMKNWLGEPYGVLVRRMDEAQVHALSRRVKQICGFANPTPAILASVFRTIGQLAPHKQNGRTLFKTDLPLNLRPPGKMDPIFHNFMSFVQMSARKADLEDRDAATRYFNARLRDQIRRGIDLGNLQMMHVLAPRANMLRKHIISQMKHQPFTLGFGFLGPVTAGLECLLGNDVQWYYCLNSAISPPGITLQANQSGAGMNVMLTYIESAVDATTASALLEGVIDDLTRSK